MLVRIGKLNEDKLLIWQQFSQHRRLNSLKENNLVNMSKPIV